MEKSAPSILDLANEIRPFLSSQSAGIIPTPFEALNAFLGGGIQGFCCMGAAPKVGKSAFAQQIAIHCAFKGIPAFYVDIEHSKPFLGLRMLSSIMGITMETAKERLINDTLKIPPVMRILRVWPGRVDPRDIRTHLRNFGGENNLSLVVIDSLQKLHKIPGTTTRESTDIWLRELEAIKNEYPCVVLIVSEVARGEGGKNYDSPNLSMWKESGDIEYTAEQAFSFAPINREGGAYKLKVIANRYGVIGDVPGATYSHETFWCWRWKEIIEL